MNLADNLVTSARNHGDRHRVHQLCLGVAVQIQKPQQRPQPGRHVVERPGAASGGLAQPEHVHRLGRYSDQILALPTASGQEPIGDATVIAYSRERQPALGDQIADELLDQLRPPTQYVHSFRCGHHTDPPQVVQQRAHPVQRQTPMDPAGGSPRPYEPFRARNGQFAWIQAGISQPAAQMRHQPKMTGRRTRGIAQPRQLLTKAARISLQRARNLNTRW